MEGRLSYTLKPSLKEMALRRVAVLLWLQPGVFDEILQFRLQQNKFTHYEWHCSIGWKVGCSISKLPLPGSIQKQLIPILKDVGLGILNWVMFHKEYFSSRNDYFRVLHQKMCFTAAGAVDDSKTAEELVGCDALDVVERFQLACIYCLESRIPPLWRELPPLYKDEISSQVEAPHLHLILPSILEREEWKITCPELDFSPSNDFECAALLGHKTLAEYSFQMLTEEERRTSLIRTAKGVIEFRSYRLDHRSSDVVCFLLSLMTPEEQILIFKELPCEVLSCFLDWPWRDLFSDIADVVWSFLPESKYDHLVQVLRSKFNALYYFPKFYRNLFLRCPITFRKFFVEKELKYVSFLRNAVKNEDTETIRVVFRDLDAADRVRLLSLPSGIGIICLLPEKWHVVEEFLQDSAPSREDKRRLEKAFLVSYGEHLRADDAYRSFFEYVDDVDETVPSKRRH